MNIPEGRPSQWVAPWPPLALLSLFLIFSFLWRVWPTPYAYLTIGDLPFVYRVHRVTGEAFYFVIGEGWKSVPNNVPPATR